MPTDKQSMSAGLLQRKEQDLYIEASKEIKVKYPKEPASDAPIEEQEKYQEERLLIQF